MINKPAAPLWNLVLSFNVASLLGAVRNPATEDEEGRHDYSTLLQQ